MLIFGLWPRGRIDNRSGTIVSCGDCRSRRVVKAMRCHLGVTVRLIVLVTLLAAPASLRAQEDPPNPLLVPLAPLNEHVLHVSGDPERPVDLIVTLMQPDGPGPFPLAVMNHGANGSTERPSDMQRHRFTLAAYYFLSRGYAVALPMMRGYGESGGQVAHHGCDLAQMAMDNGRDIAGVIQSLAGDAQLDTSRVIVAGQSFGGWNALGLGALQPASVSGLVSFSGGAITSACGGDAGRNALVNSAARLGGATRVPSIWFFGENDKLFPQDVWRAMHAAYVDAGGQADLVDIGSFMEDSHQMLGRPESVGRWAPALDAFLRRIGMPGSERDARYMPLAVPAATRYAAIDDMRAVPFVTEAGREAYAKFLTLGLPRVFMISENGSSVTATGGFDPLGHGFRLCAQAGLTCFPYAVDSDIVWSPPKSAPRPPATHFADISAVNAVPWVSDKGRDNYRAFLGRPGPRAFVIGPDGEIAAVFGNPDPLGRALAACGRMHVICRPYAVDDDVVWTPPPAPATPPPTDFAPISDVNAVPWVSPSSRALYARFLTVRLPRAFVVARGGQAASTQGGYDPLGRALEKCRAAGLTCRPYAVDNKVVWVRPPG